MKYIIPAIAALLLSCQAAATSETPDLEEIKIKPEASEAMWKEKPSTQPVTETQEEEVASTEEPAGSEEVTNREKLTQIKDKIYSFFDELFSGDEETVIEEKKEEVVADK